MNKTINLTLLGYDLVVEYDYQPEEPMTQFYPGCKEEVEITAVKVHHDIEIIELMGDKQLDTIQQRILELI